MSAINPIPYAGQGVAAPYVPPAPQSTDPLQVARELQQFQQQGAMGPLQVQSAQQGLQSGAISLQQQQQALNDQNIIRQFYMGQGAPPAGGGQTPPAAAVAPPAAAPTAAQPGLTPGPAAPPQAVPAGAPQAMPAARPAAIPGAPPVVGLDLGALARAGVSGGMLQSLAGTQLKYAADYQNLTKGQQEISDKNHADAAKALQGLYYAAPEDQQAGYAGVRDMVRRLAPDDPGLLPDQLPADPKQAQNLLAMHIGFMGAHESIVANAKSAADTEKLIQDTAAAHATTEETLQKTRTARAQADAIDIWKQGLQTGSDTGAQMIQHSIGFNPAAADGFVQRYNIAAKMGDYKAMQDVLADASKYGVENNPTTRAQNAAQAGAVAKAEVPARETEAAFTSGLENQRTAAGKVQSSLDDFGGTLAAAKTIQQYIDLSRSGNPTAAQNIKQLFPALQLAMFDIKRLAAQPGAGGSMGTLAQSTGDMLKSAVNAVPLTDAQLSNIEPLVKTVANSAAMRHNSLATSVETAYPGYKAPRVNMPYPEAAPATPAGAQAKWVPPAVKSLLGAAGVKPGIHTLSDGSRYTKNADGSIKPM